ncbi:MAG TPA: Do family serine endopeptidase, partial [candidate division Zixibacteria bacterium]|nr:Do family serine endopeptidase [candidate division Zixibacteria bacterium]
YIRAILSIIIAIIVFLVTSAEAQTAPVLPSDPYSFPDIVEKVMPTIVTVYSEQTIRVRYQNPGFGFDDDFFRRFFGMPDPSPRSREPQYREYRRQGLGSGVIVTENGYVLTNNHVISEADEIKVKISGDDKEYIAQVVGTDEKSDLAVLKIEPDKPLTAATLGNSDEIRIGEWVLAIGHPFELDHTVTAGIISAKGRNRMGITDYEDFIQTDAAINPGNSGGALINLHGEVIGINTAIASRTGVYSGIGFAIPVNMARIIMDQLIDRGYVSRGYIGVGIQDITPDLAIAFDLDEPSGVLVTRVMPDSPGDKAGLLSGDILLTLDGEILGNGSELRNRVAEKQPGSKISLRILRDGKERNIEVVLTELPGAEKLVEELEETEPQADIGLELSVAEEGLAREYGYSKGLLVDKVEPGSVADKAGILPGDILFEIERKPVGSVAEYERHLAKIYGKKPVLLLIGRGGGMMYLVIKAEE